METQLILEHRLNYLSTENLEAIMLQHHEISKMIPSLVQKPPAGL